jgi:predicted nucleic acid-binding protein
VLLDSNILIYGARAEHPALDAILDRTDRSASVTRIETLGFHGLSEIDRPWLETAFARTHILPHDSVAERAIALRREGRMRLADAIIVTTALVHGLPLVTRNVDDFLHLADLEIKDPFAPAA